MRRGGHLGRLGKYAGSRSTERTGHPYALYPGMVSGHRFLRCIFSVLHWPEGNPGVIINSDLTPEILTDDFPWLVSQSTLTPGVMLTARTGLSTRSMSAGLPKRVPTGIEIEF